MTTRSWLDKLIGWARGKSLIATARTIPERIQLTAAAAEAAAGLLRDRNSSPDFIDAAIMRALVMDHMGLESSATSILARKTKNELVTCSFFYVKIITLYF